MDLATRLRSHAQNEEMVEGGYTEAGKLLNEAADKIERLTPGKMECCICKAGTEIGFCEQCHHAEIGALRSRVARRVEGLEAKVERLRGAAEEVAASPTCSSYHRLTLRAALRGEEGE